MAKLTLGRFSPSVRPIRIAYADSHISNFDKAIKIRNLQFAGVSTKNKKLAQKQVNQIGKYNEFSPSRLSSVISSPEVKEIRVAREGSPAIYFTTTKPIITREKLKRVFADEVDVVRKTKNGKFVVRAWWD